MMECAAIKTCSKSEMRTLDKYTKLFESADVFLVFLLLNSLLL